MFVGHTFFHRKSVVTMAVTVMPSITAAPIIPATTGGTVGGADGGGTYEPLLHKLMTAHVLPRIGTQLPVVVHH